MFPRRATTVNAVVCMLSCIAVFVFFVSPVSWHTIREEWEKFSVDESQIRSQLRELQSELNVTYDSTNKSFIEIFRYVKSMRDQLPVNPHKFQFVLNPTEVCANKDIFLLAYIHTAPKHYRRRAAIRETWANPQLLKNINFRIVFLMGSPVDKTVQDAVSMESDLYGDIVQENFIDSYRNLTFKAIMGLKWLSRHCPHVKYVLKTDDDIFVNIFNVVNHLQSVAHLEHPQRTILCMLWTHMKVVRDTKSKWYVPRSEFAPDYFPWYCSGSAFIFTGDLSHDLYNASFTTRFFWVDDFYVTGLLAEKVGAVHKKINSVYSLNIKTFRDKFTAENKWRTLTFGHVHNLNWWFEVWKNILNDKRITLTKPH